MPIVNCITDLWLLFYNVHETLTDIVSNVYLFYVLFAGLRLGLGLGTAGLDYKIAENAVITQSQAANHHRLLNHVTLGLVDCRSKQPAQR